MSEQKEGCLRLLTLGEIKIARTVFGEAIHYSKVWIHHGSYLPFGLQNKDTAMTPNGELYFRTWYTNDFFCSRLSPQASFHSRDESCMAA